MVDPNDDEIMAEENDDEFAGAVAFCSRSRHLQARRRHVWHSAAGEHMARLPRAA